jgi:hypothetical protein
LVLRNRLLRKYDAEPERWAHRKLVEIGRVLGMVGVGLFVLGLVLLVLTRL